MHQLTKLPPLPFQLQRNNTKNLSYEISQDSSAIVPYQEVVSPAPVVPAPGVIEQKLAIGAGCAFIGLLLLLVAYLAGKQSAPAPVATPSPIASPAPQPIIVMPPAPPPEAKNRNCTAMCF
jgi:hypothetical protein